MCETLSRPQKQTTPVCFLDKIKYILITNFGGKSKSKLNLEFLNLNSLRGNNNILLTAQKNGEERELLEQLTQIKVGILNFGTTILEESENIQIGLHNNSGNLFVYVKATEGKKKNIGCIFDEKGNQILPWGNYSNAEICIFKINGQIIFRISNFQGFYFFCPRQGYLGQIEGNQKVYKAMNSANLDNYQDLGKIHG